MIQYKNDLFDIARSKTDELDASEKVLKVVIEAEIFNKIIKTVFTADNTILDATIEKTEMSYVEEDKSWSYVSVFQVGSPNLLLTWQQINTVINEAPIELITLIQINYIKTAEEEIYKFIDELAKNLYKEPEFKSFYAVELSGNQFTLSQEKVEDKKPNLELNYGKDFVKIHENIIKLLSEKNSGIIVLDGEQGTGKTAYIKYLISVISEYKDVIYIPRYLLQEMANPDFIAFIRDQRNSIIILEDADDILSNREDGLSSIITTNILSITNGLLNDQLKIQLIATFNTDRKYIDKKLLKNGKIIEDWSFKKLTVEQANALATNLGMAANYTVPTALSEVYDDYEVIGKDKKKTKVKKSNKKRVGFTDDSE